MPIGTMQVLDQVNATVGKAREKCAERAMNMLHDVTSIVDNDIDASHFIDHARKKGRVILGTDTDFYTVSFAGGTGWVDIDSED